MLFSFGLLTCLISGLLALVEVDLKKVVALRTLSQMGFLVITLGFGAPSLSLLHLFTHAFFKSCLFIQVGLVIHLSFSFQDGRSFLRCLQLSRCSSAIVSVCLFSLCGLLFSGGFVRKDVVLQVFEVGVVAWVYWFLMFSSIVFTYLYSLRLWLVLNSSSLLASFSLFGSLYSFLYSFPLLVLGVGGGWVVLWRSESFPVMLRFWRKILPLSTLSLGLILFFV